MAELETQEKTFTQSDIDRIVGERLSREGVQDSKEIVELLKEFDYSGTPAEVKATLRVQAEAFKQQKAEQAKQVEIDALKAEADQTGASPEILAEIKTLKAEMAEIKKKDAAAEKAKEETAKAIETRKTADEAATKSYTEACEEYGADVVDQLAKDEDFLDYIVGKINTPIKTLVEKFLKLKGKAYEEGLTKANSKASRSTGSGSGKLDSGTYNLTDNQKKLAEENGMSNKEYAESLKLVKK